MSSNIYFRHLKNAALSLVMATFACYASALENTMPEVEINPAPQSYCPVLELRQYTLHPGQRDVLIALFEREFIESQENLSISIVGQFTDLDNPDRFVWLRGFADMPSRARALNAFYSGPVWQAHRNAANVTMLDSDNVLLLRPASVASGFALPRKPRPGLDAPAASAGIMIATIYYFGAQVDPGFAAFFDSRVAPVLTNAGAEVLATLVTETSANTFPRLPVREHEPVFIWFTHFANPSAFKRFRAKLDGNTAWTPIQAKLEALIVRDETLRLAPTPRSLLPAY